MTKLISSTVIDKIPPIGTTLLYKRGEEYFEVEVISHIRAEGGAFPCRVMYDNRLIWIDKFYHASKYVGSDVNPLPTNFEDNYLNSSISNMYDYLINCGYCVRGEQ
ncbi:hypothetical protein GD1_24 [Paraglaciecola Antarctic GD virus 1]|nr:hypothetical protein GD1_24 [Paraglaciecola Antarctic GD virus 1]